MHGAWGLGAELHSAPQLRITHMGNAGACFLGMRFRVYFDAVFGFPGRLFSKTRGHVRIWGSLRRCLIVVAIIDRVRAQHWVMQAPGAACNQYQLLTGLFALQANIMLGTHSVHFAPRMLAKGQAATLAFCL